MAEARRWLSVRVELVSGRGVDFWPRPGRIFAAAAGQSFADLAEAIDGAFARWDRAHLYTFTLADGTVLTEVDLWDGDAPDGSADSGTVTIARLTPGEQFAYLFDLSDDWAHLCTVGADDIDPIEELGRVPDRPLPYEGWGELPDQYGRRWEEDDGESAVPRRPARALTKLPPLLPGWGPPGRD